MSQTSEVESTPSRTGEPATLVRIIGWSLLSLLGAFLINNVLVVGFNMPGIADMLESGVVSVMPVLIYLAALVISFAYVLRTPNTALRWDARLLHNFNLYLIRAVFWAVLMVGIVDATIAFMRVENLLPLFLDENGVKALGRAQFVGPYVHTPLIVSGFVIALFTRTVGFPWLALMIVGAELIIVISRFIFSYEQALMSDLVRYWYAALFLFASAYTLFDEGHVRVDVFYAGFKNKTRGFVNAFGSIFLGISTCIVILGVGLGGKRSIINAPILNFEITQTGAVGMFVKYQMAAFLAVFAITMTIQFISYFLESVADFRGEDGTRLNREIDEVQG